MNAFRRTEKYRSFSYLSLGISVCLFQCVLFFTVFFRYPCESAIVLHTQTPACPYMRAYACVIEPHRFHMSKTMNNRRCERTSSKKCVCVCSCRWRWWWFSLLCWLFFLSFGIIFFCFLLRFYCRLCVWYWINIMKRHKYKQIILVFVDQPIGLIVFALYSRLIGFDFVWLICITKFILYTTFFSWSSL